nr:reverse transcriptase domain-containing protein [Tanacetum cinerariifolium]
MCKVINIVRHSIYMETGVRVGRRGRGKRPREGNDERVDDLNGQENNQGIGANGGVERLNGNVEGANRGASNFSTIIAHHEMQKLETELWNHAMVRAGHTAYTDRFQKLARLVPHLISGALIDEAVRNGSIKKVKKRGNIRDPS